MKYSYTFIRFGDTIGIKVLRIKISLRMRMKVRFPVPEIDKMLNKNAMNVFMIVDPVMCTAVQ